MAIVDNKSYTFVSSWGGGPLDFQAWRTDKLADESFEYHAFIAVNPDQPRIRGKGSPFMVIRITTPNAIESIQEYYMGVTGYEGDADDTATTAWTNRAALTYKRYDEVIKEYFH